MIYYIQEIFKLEEYYKKKNEVITQDIQKKVSECVKESIEKKYESMPGSSMKFSEFNKYHKLILDNFHEIIHEPIFKVFNSVCSG